MSVVQVRIVRVSVRQGCMLVPVPVRVRLPWWQAAVMLMPMMLVVPVAMFMPDRLMDMLVVMSL